MEQNLTSTPVEQSGNGKTFVLVHGAWQAPYAWESVKNMLSEQGYKVTLVCLPGHGDDQGDSNGLHMASYIKYVSDVVTAIGGKVILAGHSMAGMIISGVAEEVPALIETLVYIAAYVPESGQSAYALSLLDKQSLLGASLLVSDDQQQFDIIKADIINIFCQDAPNEVQEQVLAHYRSEPAAPFSDPVILTETGFGSVPKYYVETLKDHGIGNDLQKQMIATAGISRIYTLNSGHSPSLTMPFELSEIMHQIAQQ